MKKIDTLVDDIYDVMLNGSQLDSEKLSGIVLSFAKDCADIMSKAIKKREEREPRLRMSNIGKKPRQLWYEMHGAPKESMSGHTLVKFLYGDLIEAMILALAEAAGHTVEDKQARGEVDGIEGSIDCKIDGKLIDVKSTSPFAFKNKFKETADLGDDPFGYAAQGAGYEAMSGTPFHGWLAIDKVSGEIRLSKASDLPDVKELIHRTKEAVTQEEPPERCYPLEPDGKSGNMKLGIGCSYCSFKHHCYADANDGKGLRIFLYSGRPVFLAVVKKEPRVSELSK